MELTSKEHRVAEAEKEHGIAEENLETYTHESLSASLDFSPQFNNNLLNNGKHQQEKGFSEIEIRETEAVAADNKVDSKSQILLDIFENNISPESHMDKVENIAVTHISNDTSDVPIIQPHSHLPKPEAPPGISHLPPKQISRSKFLSESFATVDMPSIGKFIKDRSNSLSASIAKRLSSLKDQDDVYDDDDQKRKIKDVTEFNISGLKVTVTLKNDEEELKGRISFFSRSNCRDSTAVRSFFRQRGLKFVEINIDVYPQREKELVDRTGSCQVPQIFFNDKLFGGLVALNSLRNSGAFDHRLREMLAKKCSSGAPAPPVYGFDDPEEEESTEQMVGTVRVLRQRLPIQDRLMKMKIIKNCFAGSEMVEVLIHHLDCGRKKVRACVSPIHHSKFTPAFSDRQITLLVL